MSSPAVPAAQAPATARADPLKPTNGAPARPAGQKLRDCCQSCARSKIRCTKEKPSCSRCETKGLTCMYLYSRRPGRIPGSGQRSSPAARSRPGAASAPSHNAGDSHTTDNSVTVTTSLSPSSTVLDGLGSENSRFRADSLLETYYGGADALGMQPAQDLNFSGDNSVSFMWDDCLNVLANMDDPIYSNMMEWDTCESAGSALTAHLLPTASHVMSTSIVSTETGSQASTSTLPSLSSSAASLVSPSLHPLSLSTRTTPPATVITGRPQLDSIQSASSVLPQELHTTAGTSSSCNCLDGALDLLKEVNKDPCPDLSETGCATTTQAILAKNKEIIQATLNILACVSCMQDRLLIMISLLITMKMLPRYAFAAALTGSAGQTSDEDRISVRSVDQNSLRQAKQQVLRELHLVQRLITQLSSRLKSLSSPRRDSVSAAGLLDPRPILRQAESNNSVQKQRMRNSSIQGGSGESQLTPISDRTLDVVEDDVRHSLSLLSASVRNALKEC